MLFEIFKHYAAPYLNDKLYCYSLKLPNSFVGSKQLQQISWKSMIENLGELEKSVSDFIEYIWNESLGDLKEIFDMDFNNPSCFSIEIVCFFFFFLHLFLIIFNSIYILFKD